MSHTIVVAGLSGSGKSTALNVLEDSGTLWFKTCRLSSGLIGSRALPRSTAAVGLHLPGETSACRIDRDESNAGLLEASDQSLVRRRDPETPPVVDQLGDFG